MNIRSLFLRVTGAFLVFWFIYAVFHHFNEDQIQQSIGRMLSNWWYILLFIAAYTLAFYVRSKGWAILLDQTKVTSYTLFRYHMVGLFVNHLLPVKAGDAARVYLTVRNHPLDWKAALQAVVYSRWLDMASLVVIACIAVLGMGLSLFSRYWLLILMIPAMIVSWWLWNRLANSREVNFTRLFYAWLWTLPGWILEGVVLWSVIHALEMKISFPVAAGVNSITIAGQIFHITPGGIGTYESVMSMLLKQVGFSLEIALEAALISHGLKFAYSYLFGIWALSSLHVKWAEIKDMWNRRKALANKKS